MNVYCSFSHNFPKPKANKDVILYVTELRNNNNNIRLQNEETKLWYIYTMEFVFVFNELSRHSGHGGICLFFFFLT